MGNKAGQYLLLVPTFLALKSLLTLCKTQGKIWNWKSQQFKIVLEWLVTQIPISQMKGATGFPRAEGREDKSEAQEPTLLYQRRNIS